MINFNETALKAHIYTFLTDYCDDISAEWQASDANVYITYNLIHINIKDSNRNDYVLEINVWAKEDYRSDLDTIVKDISENMNFYRVSTDDFCASFYRTNPSQFINVTDDNENDDIKIIRYQLNFECKCWYQ